MKTPVPSKPSFSEERKPWLDGLLVAGVDEAGRGALAGPVVAGALILPSRIRAPWTKSVRDSKQLSPQKRDYYFDLLQEEAIAIGVGIISHQVIDQVNILQASWLAMKAAVEQLPRQPGFLLVDGTSIPGMSIPQKKVINGDETSISIACASIIAKVTRDRLMVELDRQYPGYGLAQHKGYGTEAHLAQLVQLGPSAIHRLTFSPVGAVVADAS